MGKTGERFPESIIAMSQGEQQQQEHEFVGKCIPLQAGVVEIPRLVLQGVPEHDQVRETESEYIYIYTVLAPKLRLGSLI